MTKYRNKPEKYQTLEDHLKFSSAEKRLLKEHSQFKLQIELVPSTCWWTNVRKFVTKKEWDIIRLPVYARANYYCEICGEQGTKHPVECHEIWSYDEATLTQRLKKFQALCPLCHEVKHIGFAALLGNSERASERFIRINDITIEKAKDVMKVVNKQHGSRSIRDWKLDISHLSTFGLDYLKIIARNEKKLSAASSATQSGQR